MDQSQSIGQPVLEALSLSYNAFQEADLISLAVVIKDLISFPSPTPTLMVLLAEIIRELNYSQ